MNVGRYVFCFLLAFCLFSYENYAQGPSTESAKIDLTNSRLLVLVDPEASFSVEEFARASSAMALPIDLRNPYQAFNSVFLQTPLVVIPRIFKWYNDISWFAARYGYRYVIFKDETLSQALETTAHLIETGPRSTRDFEPLTLEQSTEIYQLMNLIDEAFTTGGVTYWVGRETLLGALTHGGLRPWDDYLYLYMFDADEAQFKSIQNEFENRGLEIHSYWKGFYKIHHKDARVIADRIEGGKNLPFCYPAANLFVMFLEKGGDVSRGAVRDVYVHRSDNFYAHWHHDRFEYDELLPVQRMKFGPFTISAPSNPQAYLNRVFGSQEYPNLWEKYTFEPLWDHQHELPPSYGGSALVKVEDFSPAVCLLD